jgi:hypothetical protein
MTQLQTLVVNELSQFTIAQIEQFFSSRTTSAPSQPAPAAQTQDSVYVPRLRSTAFDTPQPQGRTYDGIDGVLFYELMDLHLQ